MSRLLGPLVLVTLFLGQPAVGQAQAIRMDGTSGPAATEAEAPGYPRLSLRRELIVSVVGGGLLAWGARSVSEPPVVPSGGFDPDDIGWGADRAVIGNTDVHADELSDWTRNIAMVFPFVMMLSTADPDARWSEVGARSVVYAEAMATSLGLALVGKTGWRRARPFAYLPIQERPDDPAYGVTRSRAFRSMPSGHSSSAWTGASLAMTEHLLLRPEAGSWERLGVGFVGGAFAGATGALRVAAGQHFPSDVLAGAGVGISTGVILPLVHRGRTPLPRPRAWLEMFGGALGGALVGVWVGS
jgi:membrane-associated phospholipid phosphatase